MMASGAVIVAVGFMMITISITDGGIIVAGLGVILEVIGYLASRS
jgi:hypothetical protein